MSSMGLRQGLKAARGAHNPSTEFRSTMTSPEGLHKTDVFQGRVVGVDYVNWTVDVFSQFDQIRLLNIPIGSPYLHPNRGEGIYVMPEVGSKCVVCWPGDSSPPFVLCFVMPHEVADTSSEDAPAGTTPRGSLNQEPVTASFAGGRPRAKPGDMVIRGRDGNFLVLHRGGVLQMGATELAQRVFIPMNNLIMDFCENYALHNSGGSVRWGIQEGEGTDNLPSEYIQTFRVMADEKYADIRVCAGKVHAPIPDTDAGIASAEIGSGKDNPIVYELAFAKNGFRTEDGSLLSNTSNLVKLRFYFDRQGNMGARIDGNVYIRCKKKLGVKVDGDININGGGSLTLNISSSAKMTFGGVVEMTAPVIIFNRGSKPFSLVGDGVQVALPPGLLMATPAGPAPIAPPLNVAFGSVIGPGNSTLLG